MVKADEPYDITVVGSGIAVASDMSTCRRTALDRAGFEAYDDHGYVTMFRKGRA
jgi:hypothetical protein